MRTEFCSESDIHLLTLISGVRKGNLSCEQLCVCGALDSGTATDKQHRSTQMLSPKLK